MLLLHKIEKTKFSPSEKEVINYVLKHSDKLDDLSVQSIADATYTSAPIVIRAAKKLGLTGWNDLKKQLKSEIEYLYASNDVDASIPFVISDTFTDIANYISRLELETISDTLSLLNHDLLYKAMSILRNVKTIDLYVESGYLFLAEDFKSKLEMIDYRVNIALIGSDDLLQVAKSKKDHVAIVVSYFADTKSLIELCGRIQAKQQKIIAITSLSENLLSQFATCHLSMSSREMRYTKIGEFSSTTSLKLILDCLYSCIFSLNYEEHLNMRIQRYKEIDPSDTKEE